MIAFSCASGHFRLLGDIGQQALSNEEGTFVDSDLLIWIDRAHLTLAGLQRGLGSLEHRAEAIEIVTGVELGPVIWNQPFLRRGHVSDHGQRL